jgi:hypothetical protein
MYIFIKINKVNIRTGNKVISILEHPYYKSLKYRSKEIYENFIQRNFRQRMKKTGNYRGFRELYKKIKKEGFDKNSESIIISYKNGKYVCEHGRHRMCMLYKIYGKKLILKIKHDSLDEIINN